MIDLRGWALTIAAMSLIGCDGLADGAAVDGSGGLGGEVPAAGAAGAPDGVGGAPSPDAPSPDAPSPDDDDPRDRDDDDDGDRPWERDADPYDLDFEIPRAESFPDALTAYGLYREPLAALRPADGVVLYELSSELFTDYARKQRLVKVPEGARATITGDGRLAYPEGTVMAKTFYYPSDMREPAASIRIIETRLLVKTAGVWNVATYLWNAEQTDATLLLDGTTTDVAWLDDDGQPRATEYAVPHEGECVTCHQSNGVSAFIGPTLANLNRTVSRGGEAVNQLAHLHAQGVIDDADWAAAPSVPDYRDAALPLADRARAYLEINCAHCHNPAGWDDGSDRRMDLRYTTPADQAGLIRKRRDLNRVLENGDMPYLGTTLVHEAGVRLVLDYVNSL